MDFPPKCCHFFNLASYFCTIFILSVGSIGSPGSSGRQDSDKQSFGPNEVALATRGRKGRSQEARSRGPLLLVLMKIENDDDNDNVDDDDDEIKGVQKKARKLINGNVQRAHCASDNNICQKIKKIFCQEF